MQILDDEAKRKSITDCLSMMDFLRLALLIGHFVNFLMIMSLYAGDFFEIKEKIEKKRCACGAD